MKIIIIGAGPGGYETAALAASRGIEVVLINDGPLGGTCLNEGCIPTKALCAMDAPDQERKREVIGQLQAGVAQLMRNKLITLVQGKASLKGGCSVEVGGQTFTGDALIIATGSVSASLPIPGAGSALDSAAMLNLDSVPARLCVIGGGVIGLEFASIYRKFGSEVTVIEYLKECLPALDSDIAKRLRKLLEKRGITFRMKTAVQSLADIDTDVILMATGRKPRIQPDFACAGFAYDERNGIAVNANFETSVAGIYAIGDVNGRQMLAHAAEMQAIRAVNHILGKHDGIRFDIMPAAIFTDPEAACVGPTEDALKSSTTPAVSTAGYSCRKAFWRANGKALAMGETEGMLKLFSDAGDRIIGCHAYGAHAADMVQEVSALMCRDTTISQLRDMVHIHPTLNEILKAATD